MTLQKERLRALKQRTESRHERKYWKPQAGETIAGEVVGFTTFEHPVFKELRSLILVNEDGEHSVTMNAYLKRAEAIQNIRTGDLIAIKFLGKEKGNHGHAYNKFRVEKEAGM